MYTPQNSKITSFRILNARIGCKSHTRTHNKRVNFINIIVIYMPMAKNLKEYEQIVGKRVISEIYARAEKFSGKHILCINSTYRGGGVAEILNSIVFLFNEVGVNFGWRTLHGTPDFFGVTKKFHNALQGEKINLSERKKTTYYETNRRFSTFTHIKHDLVIVHDPQPLPLIDFYRKTQPWIFRCHLDLTKPNPEVWGYLKKFVEKYDCMILSKEEYAKKDLKIPQSIIRPAIDPLSAKNKPISQKTINEGLRRFDLDKNRPIICQVSRFDKWKSPVEVVNIFDRVRKEADCQLVMLGSLATDDPEGQRIFEKVEKAVRKSKYQKDIKLILLESDILVNIIQRASSVVIQKSSREGFGLVVSEALYKGTPVVASRIGGIPLQVVDGVTGYLHDPKDFEGFVRSIIKLLKDKKLREKLGKNGKEHITNNFLITRLMLDWFDLFEKYLKTDCKT